MRGLTTAASIWMTAAIGILVGVGFYVPGRARDRAHARHAVGLSLDRERDADADLRAASTPLRACPCVSEPEVRALITELGFSIANLSYQLCGDGRFFEYRMMIRTLRAEGLRRLAETLVAHDAVVEFRISPTGD